MKEQAEQKRQHDAMLKATQKQTDGDTPGEGGAQSKLDAPPDPLAPQERLLSKYGAMVSCDVGDFPACENGGFPHLRRVMVLLFVIVVLRGYSHNKDIFEC